MKKSFFYFIRTYIKSFSNMIENVSNNRIIMFFIRKNSFLHMNKEMIAKKRYIIYNKL